MKKTAILFLLSALPLLLGAGEFNVRKFGAKGDGKTDDTRAVQAAIDAAAKKVKARRNFRGSPKSSYYGSGVTVTFPAGTYKITGTIKVGPYINLAGKDACPFIEWYGEKNGVMFDISTHRNRVESLIFIGGGVQLQFSNRNVDKTLIFIRDCQFLYAQEIAVKLKPGKGVSHLSSQAVVEKCLFSKNYRCAQNYGDLFVVRDTWVDLAQPYMADGAAFINPYGTMKFEFCCLTPSANPDKGPLYYHNVRWVDNYARFEAEGTRFGGEGGGIPAVYNFSGPPLCHPYSSYGRISITNCLLACGQLKRENAGVIRLFDIPGSLVLENNYSSSGHPFIVCDPSLDVEKVKSDRKAMAVIKFRIANNVYNANSALGGMVPTQLKDFFKSGSDCRFGEVPAREIPKEITGPAAKNKALFPTRVGKGE